MGLENHLRIFPVQCADCKTRNVLCWINTDMFVDLDEAKKVRHPSRPFFVITLLTFSNMFSAHPMVVDRVSNRKGIDSERVLFSARIL